MLPLHRIDSSQDVFDLGFILLQCALGELAVFDPDNILTLENIRKALITLSPQKKTETCCILHSEEAVRKLIQANLLCPSHLEKNGEHNIGNKKQPTQANDYVPLLEALKSLNNVSDTFIDFLCGCLKLDSEQRTSTEDLQTHEFLSQDHHTKGPQVSLQEYLKANSKLLRTDLNEEDPEDAKGLFRLGEALRIVFTNRHIKDQFDRMMGNILKSEVEDQRISDLSSEVGVAAPKLKKKLIECLADC